MQTSLLLAIVVATNTMGASIPEREMETTNQTFQKYWGTDFEWKYEALPSEGTVTKSRVPYSGYIYPDTGGGTAKMLQKYDRAFNRGRSSATAFEQWDTTAFMKPTQTRGGLFGFRTTTRMQTPYWHGHCNGWSAAAIRHAEPQQSVVRNGVTFTRADIKGLLAEIYIYNDIEELAGSEYALNAGVFHAVMCNWLGRGSHPIAMEADPGEEKWNYPIYGYACSSARRADNRVEVRMNLAYAKDSNGEFEQSPRTQRTKSFHYVLNLDASDRIVGGSFYGDSSMIDLLWIPLRPKQGKQTGNERGNPHIDIDTVLAIWRDSVPAEARNKWVLIDPPAADQLPDLTQFTGLVPVQDPHAPRTEEAIASTNDQEETDGEAADATTETPAADGDTEAVTSTSVDADTSELELPAAEVDNSDAVTEIQ